MQLVHVSLKSKDKDVYSTHQETMKRFWICNITMGSKELSLTLNLPHWLGKNYIPVPHIDCGFYVLSIELS